MWFFLTISSALLTASQSALSKIFLKKIDKFVLASGIYLSAFAVILVVAMTQEIPEIKNGFYYALAGTVILNYVATIFYFSALKITDLSIADPIISFTPAFLIVTSFIMLREIPTLMGAVGIMLIVIASYIMNLKKNNDNKYEKSITEIFKNKGVFYMLAVAFIFSISSNFDKLTVKNSSPIFGSAAIYLLLGLLFALTAAFRKNDMVNEYKNNIHKFILVGIFSALSAIAINIALLMQIVPYVISLKRTSILFSVLIGLLIFKEKNAKERIFGAVIMLVGMLLILLY